jgi:hypothetical protein
VTTRREQQLLERCLRLEAALAGVDVAEWEHPPSFNRPARTAIVVTPALVAEMRALKAQGVPLYRICALLGCAHSTVRKYTRPAQ